MQADTHEWDCLEHLLFKGRNLIFLRSYNLYKFLGNLFSFICDFILSETDSAQKIFYQKYSNWEVLMFNYFPSNQEMKGF